MRIARAIVPAIIGWVGAVAYWIGVGPEEPADPRADAAIVLGAAVDGDEPSPVFRERIAHAIDLYEAGRVQRLVFTGARSPEDGLAESKAARAMALAEGVPAEAILTETRSATTMQNLVEARRAMESAGLSRAVIVSDPLHMRRAMEMAEALEMEAVPSATPTTRYRSFRPKAEFLLREVWFMHHFWLFGE